jgi:hypothetical protein
MTESGNYKKSFPFYPFCIMHYDDPSTNTYRGFINYPMRIKTKSGEYIFKCLNPPIEYGPWKKYHTFYSLPPMFRPIPTGLKLINATKLGKNPYSTKEINYSFDPFNIEKDAVSFITWTQPVPATVPLYLHINPEGTIYPSFEKNPPSKGNWTQDKLSPIYVLVNPYTHPTTLDSNNNELPKWEKDINGNPKFLFKGSDNRCIPDIKGVTIEQCFLKTDEDVFHENDLIGLTSLISKIQQDYKSYEEKNNNIPTYLIIIFYTLFILSLIAFTIILIK